MQAMECLLEERIPLEKVEYEQTDSLIWRVRLTFGADVIVISVDEDTDTLNVSGRMAPRDPLVDASDNSPWKAAVGKPLLSAWRMINHNNVEDGLQLQFGESVSEPTTTIQMLGVGSTVRFSMVHEVTV